MEGSYKATAGDIVVLCVWCVRVCVCVHVCVCVCMCVLCTYVAAACCVYICVHVSSVIMRVLYGRKL